MFGFKVICWALLNYWKNRNVQIFIFFQSGKIFIFFQSGNHYMSYTAQWWQHVYLFPKSQHVTLNATSLKPRPTPANTPFR